jgi:hypothetical protein
VGNGVLSFGSSFTLAQPARFLSSMCLLANDFDGEVGTVDIVLVARTKGTAGLPGNQYRHYRI